MFGLYRTVLALMVVLLHYGRVPFVGAYAVFGFFCLSGYLMTLIMHESYGYSVAGILRYGVNRFLRIYPMYWLTCLLACLIIVGLGSADTTAINPNFTIPATAAAWVKNLGLLLHKGPSPKLVAPAWALTVELFFYACIGLGLSRNKKIVALWFAASIAYTVYLVISGASLNERHSTLSAASLPYSTGAAIYHWRTELLRMLGPVATHLWAPFIGIALIFANWGLGYQLRLLSGTSYYLNYALCSLMIVVLYHRKSLLFLPRPVDKWLGDLSYPLYLVHVPLAFVFLAIYKQLGLDVTGPSLFMFAISLPALILLSWLMTVSVERPIELLRTAIKRIG